MFFDSAELIFGLYLLVCLLCRREACFDILEKYTYTLIVVHYVNVKLHPAVG